MTLAEFHQKYFQISLGSEAPGPKLAKVQGFSGDPLLIERLKEMGLHQGLEIQPVGRAPLGGPLLFRFGNTVLALREEEAQCALIQIR